MKWNWKVAILRVLVNGVVLYIVTLIVPGIQPVPGTLTDTWLDLVIVGAVMGVLNALVRPLVQLLILPLLFVSYGLILIVIDTVILYVLSWLMPSVLHIDNVFGALVGGALIWLFTTVLEGLLGMTPPLLDDAPQPEDERSPTPVQVDLQEVAE
jgi:putative membrane protein